MATNKLTAFNGYYGRNGVASFTTSGATNLYIGSTAGEYGTYYRSRVTFKPLTSIAEIGTREIKISKILLYVRRNGEGPQEVTIGCSSSSAWDATLKKRVLPTIGSTTKWYSIDVTSMASTIMGYKSNWYMHFRNGTPRLRLNGTGTSYAPYLKITWEYVASTISSDAEEVELGTPVTFTVAPELTGETHTITYKIGDASGTIATKVDGSQGVTWTPPIDLATEIPSGESGEVEIEMTVYNSSGSVDRTEVTYQTVTVPASAVPVIPDNGIALAVANGLSGYALAGESSLLITPTIDMEPAMGSNISSVVATVTDGSTVRTVKWTSLTEASAGLFTGAQADSGILLSTGTATVDLLVTDTRGRTASASASIEVYAYTRPTISLFTVERYEPLYDENEEITGYQPSDLGGYVWVNIVAGVASVTPAGTQLNSISWALTLEDAETGELLTYTGTGAQSLNLLQDRTIVTDAIAESKTLICMLTVTDTAGHSVAAYDNIAPGRANFSLAPDHYGAAFGMIANGTKDNPMLESAYPAHFYAGVFGSEIWGSGYRMDVVSQWEYVTISNSSFAAYNTAYTPRISRVGPLVFLDGMAKNTAELEAGFSATLATLPEWAWPAVDVHAIQQGSGRTIWWERVSSGGVLTIQRYRNETGTVAPASGSQFPLSLCWIAADAFTS